MRTVVGGAAGGAVAGVLVLAVGMPAAAWLAILLAALAILVGALDYARTHG